MTGTTRSVAAWLLVVGALAAPAAAVAQTRDVAPEASPATRRADAPRIRPEDLRAALAAYAREPSVRRVVRAAVRQRSASPGRVRDAMDRARATGWLPTARATVRRGQAVDLRGLVDGEPNRIATDDDLSFDASLVFRFDRIAFASEETTLLRELRVVEESREELVRTVVHLYFERRRLQLERDLLGGAQLERALRILELEALLDVFTGGAFTRMMGAR